MKTNSLFSVSGHGAFDGDGIKLREILYFRRINQYTLNSSAQINILTAINLQTVKYARGIIIHCKYVVIDTRE